MSEELKTLRDWEIKEDEEDGVVDIEWLRKEVVKWIKEMDKRTYLPESLKYNEGEIEGTIKWIKYFFNIKEEDLK
jgi:hypothetical protein